MIVDLKVPVGTVHYKGRQGSNMRPRDSFVLSSRHFLFFFFAKDLANDFNMRPPRKINAGFTKDSRKYLHICIYIYT